MGTAVAARAVIRSATNSFRTAASRIHAGVTPTATEMATAARSPFRIPTQKPLSHRNFRSPVEMSCVSVESLLPFHTATASALLTSMLSVAPRTCGWSVEGL